MPTYEYRCENCEHQLEAFHSITAKPLKKCPECGKNKLKRLISVGVGVVFKGSGFWQTDYARSSDYKKAAEADSKAGSQKSETKSDIKSESKSAGKSESKPAKKAASAD